MNEGDAYEAMNEGDGDEDGRLWLSDDDDDDDDDGDGDDDDDDDAHEWGQCIWGVTSGSGNSFITTTLILRFAISCSRN